MKKLHIPDDLSIPTWLDRKNPALDWATGDWGHRWLSSITPSDTQKRQRNVEIEAFLREVEEGRKVKASKTQSKSKRVSEDTTGMRWDARKARWVPMEVSVTIQPKPETTKPEMPGVSLEAAGYGRKAKGPADEKHKALMSLLLRQEGATKKEIAAETGWEPHTAGARISGLKKGFTVTRTREDRGTVYRVLGKK